MPRDGPVQNTGDEFADPDVARAYIHRPPYPEALYLRLAEIAPRPGHAVDLGCGPGKLATGLADTFETVTAIDPSGPMISLAQALDDGGHRNIRWVHAAAEDADLTLPFDLAVGGASLHWLRHGVVFPRMRIGAGRDGRVAAVGGDGPSAAPWLGDYGALVRRWIEQLGFQFNHPEFVARMNAHEAWIDIEGREAFTHSHCMPVADFIEGEHSRATWARAKMGMEAARAFDDDLRRMLEPHSVDGMLAFDVTTHLMWGRPRATPRA